MAKFDKQRWTVLSPLLDELLDADEGVRSVRLAQIRDTDGNLADDLDGLLQQNAVLDEEHYLEGSVLQMPVEPTLAGQEIGSYTLERLLGRGGMGAVWLARRSDGRYEGQAAIKLLNLALLGPRGADRFKREGSALARLTHTNIARLIDAGVTKDGQPYLVLEYVAGEAIDHWCDANALSVPARVRLFLQVLDAVAHAHSKLILHRDLKPSNILVTADGQVKLLDFGIAKLLDDEPGGGPTTAVTEFAGRAFTPEYAAPEQVQNSEVTTATDVYALGVLLYTLLTAQHPTADPSQTPVDKLRAIVDTDPVRPSIAVARPTITGTSARVVDPSQLVRQLQGDLDNILAMALKKAPAERYQTADALADDLRRYLDDQPVKARPDSVSYRVSRFITRNRIAVGAAAVVLLAIVSTAGVAVWQAREATAQRDRAQSLSGRNAAVVDFVSSMLTEVAPAEQPLRVADLLERSQTMLLSDETNPEHRAAILSLLSIYFLNNGNAAKAETLLRHSLELTRGGTDLELRAQLRCENAYAASLLGRLQQAQADIDEGLALSRDDVVTNVLCLQFRGFIAQNANDASAALDFALRAQARLRESPTPKPEIEASLLADVGFAHYLSGHSAEADRYYAASLAKYTAIGRSESAATFTVRNNWANASVAAGDPLKALQNYDEALRIAVARSPEGEPPVYLLSNRAIALASLARYPEALAALDRAIESAQRSGHADSLSNSIANRANVLFAMDDVALADQELARVESTIGKTLSADSVPAITAKLVRARIDAARGRLPEALAEYSAIVDFFDGRKMSIVPLTRALAWRADIHLRQGDPSAALADAQRALNVARKLQGGKPYSSLTGLALSTVARIQESRGAQSAARAAAAEAVENLSHMLGEQHPETVLARQALL